MDNIKFSVVIPVLNGGQHLRQCLDSIISQPEEVEIVVIDGGSTDNTLEILDFYKRHITYTESGRDSGIANAMNRGISKVGGEMIAILNSDDYWEPNVLRHVSKISKENRRAEVITGFCRLLPLAAPSYVKKPNLAAMKRYMSAYHPATFVKKDVYQRVGPYNECYALAMDSEWMHRALTLEVGFIVAPTVLANMRLGGVSDREAKAALAEYKRSVIENGLALPQYAEFFYRLHIFAKFLEKNVITRCLKRFVNCFVNPTIEI